MTDVESQSITDLCVPSSDDRILLVGEHHERTRPNPLSQRRDEFTVEWIYRCPPVVVANQMGYVVRAPFPIRARWNGGDDLSDLYVRAEGKHPRFTASSHFGMGIVTVQVGYTFRTPPGVGTYVKAPPNVWRKDVTWLEAFVETDTLRRDFTFNIKINQPNVLVRFETFEPIGCVLPYPIDLVGKFDFEYPTDEQMAQALEDERKFAESRLEDVKDYRPSQLYRKGRDAEGKSQRKPLLKIRTPEHHR